MLIEERELTITGTESEVFHTRMLQGRLAGIHIPAGFTGTGLTFRAHPSMPPGQTPSPAAMRTVRDAANGTVTLTVTAGSYVPLPAALEGAAFIMLVAASAQPAPFTVTLTGTAYNPR